jgi:MCP family monocarboxylic acid transporter-like MFS transporter 10
MPCFLIVSTYFQRRHSLAIGFLVAGTAAGFFLFGPVTQVLIDAVGWRNCYRIMSSGLLGCCFISILFNSNVEKKEHNEGQSRGERNSDNNTQVRKKMLDCSVWKIPSFTIPVIYLTIAIFSHYSPAIHMVSDTVTDKIVSCRGSGRGTGRGD